MGVYTIPRGRHWTDYIAPAVGNLLGGVIDNQFAKAKEARELKQKEADRQAGLAYLTDPQNSFDLRNNPDGAARSYMAATMHGVSPEVLDTVIKTLGVPTQRNTVDLGDRTRVDVLDPLTGNLTGEEYAHGLNPTRTLESDNQLQGIKYNADEATKRTRISEGGANARNSANVGLGYAQLQYQIDLAQAAADAYGLPMQGPDGELLFPRQSDGTVKKSGVNALLPTPKGGQQKPALTAGDISKLKGTNRDTMGRVVDPELERQYDAMLESLIGGGAQQQAPPLTYDDLEGMLGAPSYGGGMQGVGNFLSRNKMPYEETPQARTPMPSTSRRAADRRELRNPTPSNQLPVQPTEVLPGTNTPISDPRVQQALSYGYTLEEIAARLKGI